MASAGERMQRPECMVKFAISDGPEVDAGGQAASPDVGSDVVPLPAPRKVDHPSNRSSFLSVPFQGLPGHCQKSRFSETSLLSVLSS